MMPVTAHGGVPSAVLVLSAHLDDGVLSTSARLLEPETVLVTVFAAGPPADLAVTPWGQVTGATSMQERHAERLVEDERAAAVLGCRTLHLDEPEEEYRTTPADLGALASRVAALVQEAGEVWAPAAIGGHPDHRLVRDAALTAWHAERGARELFLYADLPYALRVAWPSRPTDTAILEETTAWLGRELEGRGSLDHRLDGLVRWLTPEERRRKAEAARAYGSQLGALGLGPADEDRWDRLLRCEVAWRVRLPA